MICTNRTLTFQSTSVTNIGESLSELTTIHKLQNNDNFENKHFEFISIFQLDIIRDDARYYTTTIFA